MDKIPVFSICPSCGLEGFDRLKTHAYCVQCNYSPDFDEGPNIPPWVFKYIQETKKSFVRKTGEMITHATPIMGAA